MHPVPRAEPVSVPVPSVFTNPSRHFLGAGFGHLPAKSVHLASGIMTAPARRPGAYGLIDDATALPGGDSAQNFPRVIVNHHVDTLTHRGRSPKENVSVYSITHCTFQNRHLASAAAFDPVTASPVAPAEARQQLLPLLDPLQQLPLEKRRPLFGGVKLMAQEIQRAAFGSGLLDEGFQRRDLQPQLIHLNGPTDLMCVLAR